MEHEKHKQKVFECSEAIHNLFKQFDKGYISHNKLFDELKGLGLTLSSGFYESLKKSPDLKFKQLLMALLIPETQFSLDKNCQDEKSSKKELYNRNLKGEGVIGWRDINEEKNTKLFENYYSNSNPSSQFNENQIKSNPRRVSGGRKHFTSPNTVVKDMKSTPHKLLNLNSHQKIQLRYLLSEFASSKITKEQLIFDLLSIGIEITEDQERLLSRCETIGVDSLKDFLLAFTLVSEKETKSKIKQSDSRTTIPFNKQSKYETKDLKKNKWMHNPHMDNVSEILNPSPDNYDEVDQLNQDLNKFYKKDVSQMPKKDPMWSHMSGSGLSLIQNLPREKPRGLAQVGQSRSPHKDLFFSHSLKSNFDIPDVDEIEARKASLKRESRLKSSSNTFSERNNYSREQWDERNMISSHTRNQHKTNYPFGISFEPE